MEVGPDQAHDPFVVAPPDEEFLAMQAAFRRKGIMLGSVVAGLGVLLIGGGVLLLVATASLFPAGYLLGFGFAILYAGVAKVHKAKHS